LALPILGLNILEQSAAVILLCCVSGLDPQKAKLSASFQIFNFIKNPGSGSGGRI
jgi:hypothetical protein